MKTTVILIRHGETIWNREGRIQGQTDISLSKKGIKEAKTLAERIRDFDIDHVYTSKLKRAIHTSEIALEGTKLSLTKDKGLNERHYGEYEGQTWKEVEEKTSAPHTSLIEEIKNGESKQEFTKRVLQTFKRIIVRHKGETILIVSHGGVMRVLIRYLKRLKEDILNPLPNASISIFEIKKDRVIEKMFGDVSHL